MLQSLSTRVNKLRRKENGYLLLEPKLSEDTSIKKVIKESLVAVLGEAAAVRYSKIREPKQW